MNTFHKALNKLYKNIPLKIVNKFLLLIILVNKIMKLIRNKIQMNKIILILKNLKYKIILSKKLNLIQMNNMEIFLYNYNQKILIKF